MVLLAVICSIVGFLCFVAFVAMAVYLVRRVYKEEMVLEIPPDGVYRIEKKSVDPITGRAEYKFTLVGDPDSKDSK